ncbi:hypothetical protein D3C72_1769000 [compost metagenome]
MGKGGADPEFDSWSKIWLAQRIFASELGLNRQGYVRVSGIPVFICTNCCVLSIQHIRKFRSLGCGGQNGDASDREGG